jgi:hypothetical protein
MIFKPTNSEYYVVSNKTHCKPIVGGGNKEHRVTIYIVQKLQTLNS